MTERSVWNDKGSVRNDNTTVILESTPTVILEIFYRGSIVTCHPQLDWGSRPNFYKYNKKQILTRQKYKYALSGGSRLSFPRKRESRVSVIHESTPTVILEIFYRGSILQTVISKCIYWKSRLFNIFLHIGVTKYFFLPHLYMEDLFSFIVFSFFNAYFFYFFLLFYFFFLDFYKVHSIL